MPNQPAIEDEVMSLVGSTDCLASGVPSPVVETQPKDTFLNNTKVMQGNAAAPERIVKASAGKLKVTKTLSKSKLCDKQSAKKKAVAVTALDQSKVIPTPNRTRTFIANHNTTVTKTPLANGTVVLLKRDNTFDITDNNPVAGGGTFVNEPPRVQETPMLRQNVAKVRPKCLQLDSNLHSVDSPLRFSLDNFPASTPMDTCGSRAGAMHENAIDNTFLLEQTPKINVTRTVAGDLTDKEVQLIQFDATVNVTQTIPTANLTITKAISYPPHHHYHPAPIPHLDDDLKLIQCVKSRESLGLLSTSQMARLEESFGSANSHHEPVSNLIKFDDSHGGDKTLVPEAQTSSMSITSVSVDDKAPVAPLLQSNYHPRDHPLEHMSKVAQRLSFSKFPDISLSCSFDLEDITNPIKTTGTAITPTQTESTDSYEMEESLGILTADQMKDFGDTTASRPSLDLCLLGGLAGVNLRVEQTPSPEELPLDPPLLLAASCAAEKDFSEMTESALMKSSSHSKGSHLESSVITSITSLDGYQGDGEMSRPASRNAEYSNRGGAPGSPAKRLLLVNFQPPYHHPLKGEDKAAGEDREGVRAEVAAAVEDAALGPVVRRMDPMTDSDFFTESEADDIFHRGGDRRAQIIDGQLYGQDVIVVQQQQEARDAAGGETSGMESSGVFTDNEPMREELQFDMSPDDRSTETVQSSGNSQRRGVDKLEEEQQQQHPDEDLDGTIRYEELDLEEEAEKRAPPSCTTIGDKNNQTTTLSTTSVAVSDKMEVDMDLMEQQAVDNSRAGGQVLVVEATTTTQSGNCNNTKPAAAAKRLNSTSGRSCSSSPPIIKKKMVEQPAAVAPATPNGKVQVSKLSGGLQQQSSSAVKKTPNKWDAVMNKIARNHSATPAKNYNEVKSRVNSAPKSRSSVASSDGGDVVDQHQGKSLGGYSRNSPSSKRSESCVTNPSKR